MNIEDKYLKEEVNDGAKIVMELRRDLISIKESFLHKSSVTSITNIINRYDKIADKINSVDEDTAISIKGYLNQIVKLLNEIFESAQLLTSYKSKVDKLMKEIK